MSNGFGSPPPAEQAPTKVRGLPPAVDAARVQQQWATQFEDLEDPRGLQGREHAFLSIVLIAIKRDNCRVLWDGRTLNCMPRATSSG